MSGVNDARQSASAEFVVQLERRGPEPWPVADRDAADGVDDRERRDRDAAVGLRGGRTKPALEIGGRRAEAGADAAEREIGARRTCRGVAEIAIGRETPQALLPPFSRSKQIAPGTIGMTASRMRRPRPCSASQACTPPAASSPSAEPPESAMASIASTVLAGSSRPSSRVPGPPPRTSIEATAGWSKMIAVTPEARAASSAWPTRTPAMSVRRFFKAPVRQAAAAFLHGYSSRAECSTGKRQPDHPGEFGENGMSGDRPMHAIEAALGSRRQSAGAAVAAAQ